MGIVLLAVGSIRTPSALGRELFPVPRTMEEGTLRVSEVHTLWYARFGNPEGKPVIVLHGGPGFGSYPRLTQYFDPKKFRVVLHDQRGAGRSRPSGEIRENTTQELIADIERLREHLGIEGKVILFGGSWGSTLALAYAEAHPERVAGMVLRGIFLGTSAELENVYGGAGPQLFFPDALAEMKAALPDGGKEFTPKRLHSIIEGPAGETRTRVVEAWTRYCLKLCLLHVPDAMLADPFGAEDPLPPARIDTHYAANGFFLREGQLLAEAGKLAGIPVTLLNGRYDMICPPVTAHRLHARLPGSKLVLVEEAGHSESEPGTTQALLEAVAAFE